MLKALKSLIALMTGRDNRVFRKIKIRGTIGDVLMTITVLTVVSFYC